MSKWWMASLQSRKELARATLLVMVVSRAVVDRDTGRELLADAEVDAAFTRVIGEFTVERDRLEAASRAALGG